MPGRRRRWRPHDHLNLSTADATPLAAALGIAQVAVQNRDLAASTAEALDGLRGQADLRHQDQGFFSLAQHLFNGPEVQFGLAASRHPMQQESMETTGAEGRFNGRPGPQLVGIQVDGSIRRGGFLDFLSELVHAPDNAPCQPFFQERRHRSGTAARLASKLPGFDRMMLREAVRERTLAWP